jgi:hypothetical protein
MSFKSKAQARALFKESKGKEVTSGVKAPAPEVTSGVKASSPEVTSGLDAAKAKGAATTPAVNKSVEKGEAKSTPEVTSGVKAPAPEVKTGLDDKKKPEVTSATVNEAKEVTSGVKAPAPEVKTGTDNTKPEVTSQVKEEVEKGDKSKKPAVTSGVSAPTPEAKTGNTPGETPEVAQATEGFEGKMDESSEAKHKRLTDKAEALRKEIEALEKEMEDVKELGVKKFEYNTEKEKVAKLRDDLKALKEKKRDPLKIPGHEGDDRKGNEHMPKATKTIPSKKWKASKKRGNWKKELDEKSKVLSEGFSNAYVSKASKKNLISERVLSTYWEKAVKMQEESGEHAKSNKAFWYGVVKNFNGLLNEEELAKAKAIMTERERFNLNTEKFINCLSCDDYINASKHMNEMVDSSLKNLIDTSKIQYQKELGEKVSKKLREV